MGGIWRMDCKLQTPGLGWGSEWETGEEDNPKPDFPEAG